MIEKFMFLIFMVVAAYPVAKIGLLLMKQLSKPLANFIKNEAKRSPKIRKYIIAPTGRALLRIENKTIKQVKGIKSNEKEPVSEEEIVEMGSNALGEIILFGLLTILLLAEYNRQGDKKAIKEKTKAEEILNLQDIVIELVTEVDKMKQDIEALRKEIKIGSDVLELEEQRHLQVHDHNFLDIIGSKKRKFRGPSKFDTSSPSF